MKKILTYLCATTICFSLIAQVNVPQTTKSFYNKKTASWCGPCGGGGKTIDDAIINAAGNKIVNMKLTSSSNGTQFHQVCKDLYNKYYKLGGTGYPTFYVNSVNRTGYSGNGISGQNTLDSCMKTINNHYSASTAEINAGFIVTKTVDSVIVDLTTEFFVTKTGEFYTGVYLLEDNVTYSQKVNNSWQTVTWDDFMKASFTSGSFGNQIGIGTTNAGTKINDRLAVEIQSGWKSNDLHVIVIIWEKDSNGKYIAVNANDTPSSVVGQESLNIAENEISIYPNPVTNNVNIQSSSVDIKSIQVFNLLGERMELDLNDINNSTVNMNLFRLESGVYFLQIMNANNVSHTKRIIKK